MDHETTEIYNSALQLGLSFCIFIAWNTLINPMYLGAYSKFKGEFNTTCAYNFMNLAITILYVLKDYVWPRLHVYKWIVLYFTLFLINLFLFCIFSMHQNDSLIGLLFVGTIVT